MTGGHEDEIVMRENDEPSSLTLPIRQVEYINREPGRGMMAQTADNDPVYGKYLASLPLDELKFALAKNDSPKALEFLAALADPGQAKVDICTLAKKSAIGLPEMMQIWRSHKLVSAMTIFYDNVDAIAEHTVQDAMGTDVCCNRCDGGGLIRVNRRDVIEWITCVSCKGTGTTHRPGEHKSRQQIFAATGVISPTPAVSIVNQQITTVESVIDELERKSVNATIVEEEAE